MRNDEDGPLHRSSWPRQSSFFFFFFNCTRLASRHHFCNELASASCDSNLVNYQSLFELIRCICLTDWRRAIFSTFMIIITRTRWNRVCFWWRSGWPDQTSGDWVRRIALRDKMTGSSRWRVLNPRGDPTSSTVVISLYTVSAIDYVLEDSRFFSRCPQVTWQCDNPRFTFQQ
jgi:hypothetical protein